MPSAVTISGDPADNQLTTAEQPSNKRALFTLLTDAVQQVVSMQFTERWRESMRNQYERPTVSRAGDFATKTTGEGGPWSDVYPFQER